MVIIMMRRVIVKYSATLAADPSQEELKFPARLSEVAKSLLSGLLTKDPEKR